MFGYINPEIAEYKCFYGVWLDPNSLYDFENKYRMRENEIKLLEF